MIVYFKMIYLFIILLTTYIFYDIDNISDSAFEYIKHGIEINGALCIKIAQWISNQKSLHYILKDKLEKLHEDCPQHSQEYTNIIIQNEYGANNFKRFCNFPIASGSIGQVYRGTLITGEDVVIKVKHPDLDYQINLWFRVLDFLSRFYSLEIFDLQELKNHILLQMSYKTEFNNLLSFRENFKDIDIVKIPKPYFNSENLIIMEYIQSKKFTSLKLEEKQKMQISKLIFYIITKMCVLDNFVHGDLHYGNWGVSMDNDNKNVNNIVLYDAGIVSSSDDLSDNKEGFCICIKKKHKQILEYFFNYLNKKQIKYPPEIYYKIKKDWDNNFVFPTSINQVPIELMKNKIKIPTVLSTIILSCSLISKNLSYILEKSSNKNELFKDLYANSKKKGFIELSKYFRDFYLNDKDLKVFSMIQNADTKYGLDLDNISDISDISDVD